MPLQRLQFKPGLNRDQTNYAGEGGFYECDKIRFLSGYPQKIGGWKRYGAFTLTGICRQMYNYITSGGDNIMWLGTNAKLYQEVGANLIDVTPLRASFSTPATDNCISTTNGSTTVTITITGNGASVGDFVTISGATAVGGIAATALNANHVVSSIIDSDNFTISVGTAATSTATGGGTSIVAQFEISPGDDATTYGYGWGAGAWGAGDWGSSAITPIMIYQRDWWYDNFDDDSVMNIRNGPIYYWTYDGTYTSRAVLLSSLAGASAVPTEAMQILVSQNNKHLLAFGCTPYGGGAFDPLLIRWANQDDPTNWTPSTTTTAGFLRVSRGSRIVRAFPTRQEIVVFTNSNLYSLQFTGTTDVFALQELADNISIMSPRAVASANNVVFWMGTDKFYVYSGRVETLPTTLRQHVFQDFNYDQADQVVSGTNEGYNEVWWFYPSANATTNDRYVIYNYAEQIWYYGNIGRTAWLDTPLRDHPQAVGNGYVYNHEDGVDDDTNAMASFITTSDFDIGDGDNFTLVRRMLPDVNFTGSTAENPQVMLTVRPRNFPGSNYGTTNEPDVTRTATVPVEQFTEQVFIRARARQMGFKIQSTGLGVQWQLGAPRLDGRPDGKR